MTTQTVPRATSLSVLSLWVVRARLRALDGPRPTMHRRSRGRMDLDFSLGPDEAEPPLKVRRAERLRLQRQLERLERSTLDRSSSLFTSAGLLADELQLGPVDRELLTFLAAVRLHPKLEEAVGWRLAGTPAAIAADLAFMIGLPEPAIREALRPAGALRELRILESTTEGFMVALTLADRVCEALSLEQPTPEQLFSTFFRRAPPTELTRTDFEHASALLRAILAVLAGAFAQRARRVNVLVHGAPGVGKTAFARVLAKELDVELVEVPGEDDDGEPIDGTHRLVNYTVTQRMLAHRARALVLFDEMEDAFSRDGGQLEALLGLRRSVSGKAWKTRLLEQNATPTLWLSNSIHDFDPAFLRRFDLIAELPRPAADVRRRMLSARLAGLPVSDGWIDHAAGDERLSPALVEGAARALRLANHREREGAEAFLDEALTGLLDTQGPRRHGTPSRPTAYDLAFVRASLDLEKLAAGLAKRPRASLCLYGPPGTGKTDFVRYLASRLGRSLLVRRASDLLGKYLGETEKGLAEMFRAARDARAILLLDEADGFLRDRAMAARAWEITQVNELLVQMEAFEGIFVCTTNLFESLDPASLRRFDVKVRFDALGEEQRWRMFLASLGTTPDAASAWSSSVRAELARLHGLTPGDFATAVRRAQVLDIPLEPTSLLTALEDEWKAKPDALRRRVGFGTSAE